MATNTDDTPAGFVKRATAARHRDWLADQRAAAADPRAVARVLRELRRDPAARSAARARSRTTTRMPQWERDGRDRRRDASVPRPDLGWTGPAGAGMLPATVVPVDLGDDGLADRRADRRARTSTTARPCKPDGSSRACAAGARDPRCRARTDRADMNALQAVARVATEFVGVAAHHDCCEVGCS